MFGHEMAAVAWQEIPDFLKKRGYKNPTDPFDTPMMSAFKTDKKFCKCEGYNLIFKKYQRRHIWIGRCFIQQRNKIKYFDN